MHYVSNNATFLLNELENTLSATQMKLCIVTLASEGGKVSLRDSAMRRSRTATNTFVSVTDRSSDSL